MKNNLTSYTISALLAVGLLVGCGQTETPAPEPSQEATSAAAESKPATTAPTTPTSTPSEESFSMRGHLVEAAPSLTMMVPTDAVEYEKEYDDGRKATQYADATTRTFIMVDHYSPGTATLEQAIESQEKAVSDAGIDYSTSSVILFGGTKGTRVEWLIEQEKPWLTEDTDSTLVETRNIVVIIEGTTGRLYFVQASAIADDAEAVETIEAALSSVNVTD